jgi:predicted dehydrogenase
MPRTTNGLAPRREFLKDAGRLAAASVLAGVAIPHVHAAEDNTIRLAIIGCGSRGSGAVGNALSAPGGPVKLVAMADVFQDRLDGSHKALKKQFGDKIDVPKEQQFIGFDAYRKAIDCLRPGDVALLTTHAAFRPTHLDYAVQKGVNVFMEKSFAPDPAGVQQVLRAGEAAEKKGSKIAAGLMCRHSSARQALIQKIRDGALGDILLILATRMDQNPDPGKPVGNELLWQLRRAHCFLWVSSGLFLEQLIHQVDECCWIKDGWPVVAHGVGGRMANSASNNQNLDSYSVEYVFADGTKAIATCGGYCIPGGFEDFVTYLHGTKCAAQFSGNIHAPTSQIYRTQRTAADNVAWKPPKEKLGPHQAEWNGLLDAIRNDRPHNEARRAAYSNLAAIMGRAAVHSGKAVTWDQAMASTFRFTPNIATLTADSPAPVRIDAHGRYPVPVPGTWSEI